jgi:hypothetical protein
MEKAHLSKQEAEAQRKKSYEQPKVTFIPLKIEERLMACGKHTNGDCPGHTETS